MINITCLLSFLVATCALRDNKMTLTGLQQCRVAVVNSFPTMPLLGSLSNNDSDGYKNVT